MKNEPNSARKTFGVASRSYRIVVTALMFAMLFQLFPAHFQTSVRVSLPAVSQNWDLPGLEASVYELPLDIGPATVQASQGLSITKRAVPTSPVAQGGYITYTLSFTNATGMGLTYILITDTVPADTTCVQYFKPSNWAGNVAGCVAGEAQWAYVNFSTPFANGANQEFSYVVRVDRPLPDGYVIENLASSYGAESFLPVSRITAGENDVTHTVLAPAWAISKTSNPTDTVTAGGLIEYAITVTNTGSYTISDSFIVTDVIPLNTSFNSSPYASSVGGGVLTLTVDSTLGLSESVDVNWFALVDKPLAPGTVITNSAYGVSGGNVFTDVMSSIPVTVTVESGPLLQISKTANASTVKPGDTITYTIIYENIGTNDLSANAYITDTIPANTSFVSSNPATATQIGLNQFGWFTPSLPINSPQSIELVVQVDNPLPNGRILTNTVVITSPGVPLSNGGTDTAFVTVDSAPVLQLSKVDSPDPVLAGGTLVYTVTLQNTGTDTATNVIITDTLDSYLSYVGATPAPSASPDPDYGFSYAQLIPGASETVIITATVAATTPHGTILNNTVIATAVETGTVTTVETTTVNAPSFEIAKYVTPQTVLAGETLTYTIVYTSNGAVDVSGLRITDTFPAKVLTYTYSATGATLTDPTLPTLVFERLAPFSGTEVITVVAQVITSPWASAPTELTNTLTATINSPPLPYSAQVQSWGQPNTPFSMTLSVSPTSVVIPQTISITAEFFDQYGNHVVNGETVTYTTSLTGSFFNGGATGTTLNGLASNTLASTAPGTSTVIVQAGNISLTQVVTFASARLRLSKIANVDPVSIGSSLVYTISVFNYGDTAATNVIITDTLDAETSFVGANPAPASVITPTVVFTFANLPVGITQTIVLTADVSLTASNGYVIQNNVQATAVETSSVASAVETTTVSAPNFALQKTVTPTTAIAGQAVTYTIVYTSNGAVPVSGLRLTDTIPVSITGLSVSVSNGNYALLSNTLVYSRPAAFLGTGLITVSGNLITSPWPSTVLVLSNQVSATIDIVPAVFVDNAPLTASSGPIDSIVVTANPTTTVINTSLNVTATLSDMYGNPAVDGQSVAWTSSLAGSSILPANSTTSNGQVFASASSPVSGESILSASTGTLTGSTIVTFTETGLTIGKYATPSPVPPNGILVYTIVVSNTGNSDLTNVVIIDFLSLESRVSFVDANPLGTDVNGNREFNLGTLSGGITQTVIITVQVTGANNGDILTNIAQAYATEANVQQATVNVPVNSVPLALSKSVTPNPVLAGELVTYTISYNNNSTLNTISNIRITDTIPAGISVINVDPGGATVAVSNSAEIVFNRANLPANSGDSLIVVGRVATSPWPAAGQNVTNVATAKTASSLASVTDNATTQVRPAAPASILISANPLTTTPGTPVSVNATVNDAYGNPVFNGTSVTFSSSSPNTTILSPRNTGNGVAASTLNTINPITTTATVTASVGALNDTVQVTFLPSAGTNTRVYLPLIIKNYTPPTPVIDLLVDLIEVSPASPVINQPVVITVTIRNSGTLATSQAFWVDLYLTTTPITPSINQPWNNLAPTGVAWYIPGIGANQTITLTNLLPNDYTDPTNCDNYSYFTPENVDGCTWLGNTNSFSMATTFYATAQVDSYGDASTPLSPFGNVVEIDENNNVYNTPVIIVVTGSNKNITRISKPPRFPAQQAGQGRPAALP